MKNAVSFGSTEGKAKYLHKYGVSDDVVKFSFMRMDGRVASVELETPLNEKADYWDKFVQDGKFQGSTLDCENHGNILSVKTNSEEEFVQFCYELAKTKIKLWDISSHGLEPLVGVTLLNYRDHRNKQEMIRVYFEGNEMLREGMGDKISKRIKEYIPEVETSCVCVDVARHEGNLKIVLNILNEFGVKAIRNKVKI